MIWDKDIRTKTFVYDLKHDLRKALKEDFIKHMYKYINIENNEIKKRYEEAIYDMNSDDFEYIYNLCKSLGFEKASKIITSCIYKNDRK